ncbi:hypothetical protein WAB17_13760 [Parerythrobacter aurantius]|uniref:hypothetical protein n=1 Tax=Parerythrobacter aurantius TaxID=3127706 RepID=UPI00324B05DD
MPKSLGWIAALSVATALPHPALAQDHAGHDHGGQPTENRHRLPPIYDAQIRQAGETIKAKFGTPDLALAAGYRQPRSGTPTMGEHWVNPSLVRRPDIDRNWPEILMFAEIGGVKTLVGAAWIRREEAGAAEPALFDGVSGIWHRHEASDPLIQAMLANRTGSEGRL